MHSFLYSKMNENTRELNILYTFLYILNDRSRQSIHFVIYKHFAPAGPGPGPAPVPARSVPASAPALAGTWPGPGLAWSGSRPGPGCACAQRRRPGPGRDHNVAAGAGRSRAAGAGGCRAASRRQTGRRHYSHVISCRLVGRDQRCLRQGAPVAA